METVYAAIRAAQAYAEENYQDVDERKRPILVGSRACDTLRQQGFARSKAERLVRSIYPEWGVAEKYVERLFDVARHSYVAS